MFRKRRLKIEKARADLQEQQEEEEDSSSFYDFLNGFFPEIMKKYLLERIDPWDVPVTKEHREFLKSRRAHLEKLERQRAGLEKSSTDVPMNEGELDEEDENFENPSLQTAPLKTENHSFVLLEKMMRKSSLLPFSSPLHPLSNATHKNKRWAKELWLERAA